MLSEPLNLHNSSAPAPVQGSAPSPSSMLYFGSPPLSSLLLDETTTKVNQQNLSKILGALAYGSPAGLLAGRMLPMLSVDSVAASGSLTSGPALADSPLKAAAVGGVESARKAAELGRCLVQRQSAFQPVEKLRLSERGRLTVSPSSNSLLPSLCFASPSHSVGKPSFSTSGDIDRSSELVMTMKSSAALQTEYVVQAVENFFLPQCGDSKSSKRRRGEDDEPQFTPSSTTVVAVNSTTHTIAATAVTTTTDHDEPDQEIGSSISTTSTFSENPFDGSNILCQVCGDKASGFHYGVHACEGCKGFFRRSIQQKIQYRPCTKNQQCSIIRINRNRCQYCRLKKCIAVGMSRDAVRFGRVPKREKAKIIADMQRTSFRSRTDSLTAELEDDENVISSIIRAHADTSEILHDRVLSVLDHYRKMGTAFDLPISTVACPFNPSLQSCDKTFDTYLPAIRSVVNFAKGIPGFHLLTQEDQVTLLKATAFEILLLRSAPLFDTTTKTLLLLNGAAYNRDGAQRSLLGGKPMSSGSRGRFLIDSLFDFMNRFNQMQLSEAEIALFSAVVLVSPGRPGLRNPELVEKINDKLKQVLFRVLQIRHPYEPNIYSSLLMKISDLRTLNTLHAEKLLVYNMESQYRAEHPDRDLTSRSAFSDTNILLKPPLSVDIDDGRQYVYRSRSGSPRLEHKCEQDTVIDLSLHTLRKRTTISGSDGGLHKQTTADGDALYSQSFCPLTGAATKTNRWPSRETISFDSGKGTLSAQTSCSSTESLVEHIPMQFERKVSLNVGDVSTQKQPKTDGENMPTLKRVLQAPPLIQFRDGVAPRTFGDTAPINANKIASQGANNKSLREKHMSIASLLEKRTPVAANADSSPRSSFEVSPGSTGLSSTQVPVPMPMQIPVPVMPPRFFEANPFSKLMLTFQQYDLQNARRKAASDNGQGPPPQLATSFGLSPIDQQFMTAMASRDIVDRKPTYSGNVSGVIRRHLPVKRYASAETVRSTEFEPNPRISRLLQRSLQPSLSDSAAISEAVTSGHFQTDPSEKLNSLLFASPIADANEVRVKRQRNTTGETAVGTQLLPLDLSMRSSASSSKSAPRPHVKIEESFSCPCT